MKNLFLFSSLIFISLSAKAQEEKVKIVEDLLFKTENKSTTDSAVYFACNAQSVMIQSVSSDHFLPFKLYDFVATEENWTDIQSVYSGLQAKVPSVSISTNSNLLGTPKIRMRGDDNTIVIVDGIRYDASILNTLNPSDIESITVTPNVAAANYLRNN